MCLMNLKNIKSIVVLTGAGISKESGLDTFRGQGGLWEGMRVEDVASPQAFQNHPETVHSFYNARKRVLLQNKILPNAAHDALTRLEKEWHGDFLLVTQNVDNLHERAGSENLLHMHGEILKGRCINCATVTSWSMDMDVKSKCPECRSIGTMRVDVVWFGEMPMWMDEITNALEKCDLFISIGTSGNVYPAAGFVQVVSNNPTTITAELNLEPSLNASQFSRGDYGPATQIVPDFVNEVLKSVV